MLKLKMMLSVMMLPLVVGCTSKQSVSRVKYHRLRRGARSLPRLADTVELIISPSERG